MRNMNSGARLFPQVPLLRKVPTCCLFCPGATPQGEPPSPAPSGSSLSSEVQVEGESLCVEHGLPLGSGHGPAEEVTGILAPGLP